MSDQPTITPASTRRKHTYHAEAHALEADLQTPIRTPIKPQAYVKVHGDTPAYLSERAIDFRLEGLFSFKHAYTQAAGTVSLKGDGNWVTLATAVIEGFNVLDVVTADRIVSQISTDYPLDGYVPEVTFLGTRFEGLKIAGRPVNVTLDRNFLGGKPKNGDTYGGDEEFRRKVNDQRTKVCKGAPKRITDRYNQIPLNSSPEETFECSLVQDVRDCELGTPYGHVIDIPHFGRIHLAVVRLERGRYTTTTGVHPKITIKLTMVELDLGCSTHGSGGGGVTIVNGTGAP
jgi:hypothetical protein